MVCVGGWGGLCEWCVWEDGEGCVSGVCVGGWGGLCVWKDGEGCVSGVCGRMGRAV